jgi:hypothetical protein
VAKQNRALIYLIGVLLFVSFRPSWPELWVFSEHFYFHSLATKRGATCQSRQQLTNTGGVVFDAQVNYAVPNVHDFTIALSATRVQHHLRDGTESQLGDGESVDTVADGFTR